MHERPHEHVLPPAQAHASASGDENLTVSSPPGLSNLNDGIYLSCVCVSLEIYMVLVWTNLVLANPRPPSELAAPTIVAPPLTTPHAIVPHIVGQSASSPTEKGSH